MEKKRLRSGAVSAVLLLACTLEATRGGDFAQERGACSVQIQSAKSHQSYANDQSWREGDWLGYVVVSMERCNELLELLGDPAGYCRWINIFEMVLAKVGAGSCLGEGLLEWKDRDNAGFWRSLSANLLELECRVKALQAMNEKLINGESVLEADMNELYGSALSMFEGIFGSQEEPKTPWQVLHGIFEGLVVNGRIY